MSRLCLNPVTPRMVGNRICQPDLSICQFPTISHWVINLRWPSSCVGEVILSVASVASCVCRTLIIHSWAEARGLGGKSERAELAHKNMKWKPCLIAASVFLLSTMTG